MALAAQKSNPNSAGRAQLGLRPKLSPAAHANMSPRLIHLESPKVLAERESSKSVIQWKYPRPVARAAFSLKRPSQKTDADRSSKRLAIAVEGVEMKDEFRKCFKAELRKFIKLQISLPVAFGAVWHQTTQTIWLAEADSAALFQELISWAKKMFPNFNKVADRCRSDSRSETIVSA
jgi:hypothetical protein